MAYYGIDMHYQGRDIGYIPIQLPSADLKYFSLP